ncbi:hypothetical protein DP107_07620 [Haloglomus irregulare]|jgi:uncharacterized membrane protein|uniref:DUF502 domain-containing protein n=1 Tax=Haloglomus irregulare TaxID=2234134 RepID=A0A554NBR8_9EURY|nr:DUF502 domain-containing protein [Haloglomus irregulare]TSD14823.1 hypothetical protein DP107_07620 [Haloglomus irregulare]
MSSWKRDTARGLIVVFPILVTAYIIAWLYTQLARVPSPLPQEVYGSPFLAELLGVLVLLVVVSLLVLSVGYLMRTALGDLMEEGIDGLVNRLPGLRVVYNASKMAVETAVSGTEELQAPVKLEVWDGLRMTAFKTGKQTEDGRDVLFLPTAPNITTGFVIEVPPDRYEETNERVEDALTRILSAGFGESNEQSLVDVAEEGPASPADDD